MVGQLDIKIVKNKNLSAEIGHQFYKFNDKFVFNFTIIKISQNINIMLMTNILRTRAFK